MQQRARAREKDLILAFDPHPPPLSPTFRSSTVASLVPVRLKTPKRSLPISPTSVQARSQATRKIRRYSFSIIALLLVPLQPFPPIPLSHLVQTPPIQFPH